MKKKWTALLGCALAAAVFTACGSGQSSENTNEATAAGTNQGQTETVNMIVSWWGNQTRNERTQQVLDLYSSQSGISFDGQFAEWADYWNKLSTAAAGNTLPDIVQMDYAYLDQFVNNHLLVDLTPYVEDGTIDVSNISEDILNSGKIGDGLYAIPTGINVPTLLYNKTLLEENGIKIHDNMTMEEFYTVCKEVYEKTGYKTDVFYGNGADFAAYVLRSQGVSLYGDGKLGATEDQLKTFFDIYEKGITEGWMCEPSIYAERTIGTPEQMPLVYGSTPSTRSWCAFSWSNAFSSLQNAAGDNLEVEITTWPADNPQAANYLKPGMFFSITVDGKNLDEAAKFLNYWNNDIEANKILLGERGIPVSSVVPEQISGLMDKSSQQVIDFVYNVVEPNSSLIDPPSPEGSAEVIQAVNHLVEKVGYQELTAADAAKELYNIGNGALSK
ncbi:extracellular solute-binding protein [Enterocloster clostridioformis]|uniref:ABC transporter substrate-binding protein n=1 Tax=Enterocloster clostridioformis TaxID=1531 RepID=UPI002677391F|nr:extracellular solute-binding protein [Enterocloster clostridioformis]